MTPAARWATVCLMGVVGLSSAPARADAAPPATAESDDEAGFGDDDGFADMPADVTPVKVAPPSPWSLTGFLRSDQGVWLNRLGAAPAGDGLSLPGGDDNPFAKARQSADLTLAYKHGRWRAQVALHGEVDAAYLYRADDYDDATKDSYRQLWQVRETFVAAAFGPLEVTVGRQIVAWGEGDGMSVVDVVNPRDNREPGLADLDDIRVPVLATRVGWFTTTARGDHRVEAMVVHETCNTLWRETCFGLRTPPMGPFSPLPALFAAPGSPAPVGALLSSKTLRFEHGQTALALAHQQLLLRWVYKGAGVDLGAYAASVLDQQGVITGLDLAALTNPDASTVALPLAHLRYEVLGTSGAMTAGSALIKWELAYKRRRPFNTGDTTALPPQISYRRSDTVEAMGSLTWRGLSDTVLGLEASKVWLLDKPNDLLFPADAPSLSLRAQHTTWSERLHITAVGVAFGLQAQYGWLARGDVTWDIRDALSLSLSAVTYQPGDEFGPFSGLDRHDRLGVRLRWAFSAL